MKTLAPFLMTLSASILFLLGAAHLVFTFRGDRLHPRDPALIDRMRAVSPVLTRETTMWRAWIGFNASHSLGAMLFGVVYADLALAHGPVLWSSPVLLGAGAVLLAVFVFLGRRYWFSFPFRGVVLALVAYIAAVVCRLA